VMSVLLNFGAPSPQAARNTSAAKL
jgi:hypothetical protein